MKLLVLLAAVGVALADNTRPYIIGGEDVTEAGKWPWQGSMRVFGSHSCGISLISDTWGLTAAHCLGYPSYTVYQFGSNDRTKGGQVVNSKKIIKHEDYESGAGAFPNDIALVEFAVPIDTANAAPIDLAPKGIDHTNNTDCWITGWGYDTIPGSSLPVTLQEAHINVYSNEACKKDWSTNINPGHVCIGDKTNGRGSCNGDSGGPLVCKVDGSYELVGATSWGVVGCRTSMPSVYSRVAYFRDWIKENSGI